MDAFLIPGGFGTRTRRSTTAACTSSSASLPETTLLTSVCTGSWVYGAMGLLDGLPATNRKEPDRVEAGPNGKVAPRPAGRHRAQARRSAGPGWSTPAASSPPAASRRAWRWASTCCRRAGWDESLIDEVARVMEYTAAYDVYRDDRETAAS